MLYLYWAWIVKFGGLPIDEVPEQIRETVRKVLQDFESKSRCN